MAQTHRAVFVGCLAVLLLVAPAIAQPAAGIPNAVKEGNLTPAQKKQVADFVAAQVKAMTGEDAAAQQAARENLAREVVPGSGQKFSVQFLDEYGRQVAQQLKPLLEQPMRPRLNAAIVIAKVADAVPTSALDGVIAEMLAPKQPAIIVLWGLKAARGSLLNAGVLNKPTPLLKNIAPAVQSHPTGPVVSEAYRMLIVERNTKGQTDPRISRILGTGLVSGEYIPLMLDLLKKRVAAVVAGKFDDPMAEYAGIEWLSINGWKQLKDAQKTELLQSISDLMNAAAKLAPKVEPEMLSRLEQMFTYLAASLAVIGQEDRSAAGAALAQVASPVGKSGVSGAAGMEQALAQLNPVLQGQYKVKPFAADPKAPSTQPGN